MSDPAEKYRGQVDPVHQVAMQSIGLAHMMMGEHRAHFEKMQKARNDMDAFGGMLNPTLYRDMLHSKSFAQQERLIAAALTFLREVYAVAAEISPGAST